MKSGAMIILILLSALNSTTQDIQLHYDLRHSIDPHRNNKNYLSINFNYFKQLDTNKTGNILVQFQSDLGGAKGNMAQTFVQISTNIKFWKPGYYLAAYFSGGLGVTKTSFGYYIANAYGLGLSYPVVRSKIWMNFALLYRYSTTIKPSHDPQFNFYIGGGLFNYKIMYSSSIVFWAPNQNNGLPENADKKGRKLSFFGDPQVWYDFGKKISVGSKANLYFNVLDNNNNLIIYPTLGLKKSF